VKRKDGGRQAPTAAAVLGVWDLDEWR
jgi:hypothetical protein